MAQGLTPRTSVARKIESDAGANFVAQISMNVMPRDRLAKFIAVIAVVEIATAFLLLVDPAVLVQLLFGVSPEALGRILARCFGMAVLALAISCWPERATGLSGPRALEGMLLYNALIALLLAYVATAQHMKGVLLWPAVALRALFVLLLLSGWRRRHRRK